MPSPLKPLARARRGARFVPRTGVALSRDAEEAIFRHAEVISEGAVGASGQYFGSTMLTVELSALGWRGPLSELDQARLVVVASGSVRIKLRAMRLGRAEARRRLPAGHGLEAVRVETRITVRGERLHVDVDLEATLALPSARSQR